jgi:hypothetical protein
MLTTLKKTDGTTTADLEETEKMVAEHLIPKDDDTYDTEYHKQIRSQAKDPIQTKEDREYTIEEVKNAIAELKHKKRRGKIPLEQKFLREFINNFRNQFIHHTTNVYGEEDFRKNGKKLQYCL